MSMTSFEGFRDGDITSGEGDILGSLGHPVDAALPNTVVCVTTSDFPEDPEYAGPLRDKGFDVVMVRSGKEREQALRSQRVFAAIADFDPDNTRHRDAIEHLREFASDLRIVAMVPPEHVLSPYLAGLVEDGSFYDFHTMPPDIDRLAYVLGHVRGLVVVERRVNPAVRARPSESYMIGASEPMRDVYARIRRFAPVDAPVLITGETGTGKEVAARAIHERSAYSDGPFVPINCAAMPPTLIAAELFGHEKGTFTGAHQRKIGRLEAAQSGTVFLDEIGDMPLEVQAHLLRFLQDKTIERLGGTKAIRIDARVIVATNVDLETAVREGNFREDLYYRLNVLTLSLPPLRDRDDDIDLMACYFLEQFAREHKRRPLRLSRGARIAMKSHAWPGNVRELISTIRRGAVLANNGVVKPEDLGLEDVIAGKTPETQTLAEAKAEVERKLVLDALRKNGNIVQHAARELGISRVAFYRLLRKFDLDSSSRH